MTLQRYFVRPLLGTPYRRYFLLKDGHTVAATQISHPGGVEVPEPAFVRFAPARIEPSAPRRAQINPPLTPHKKCPRCHETKPRTEFAPRGLSSQRASWCRACTAAHKRRNHATDDLA